jgi:hypothetical protein
MRNIITIAGIFGAAISATAGDVPYGVNGLPHLADRSDVIAIAKSATVGSEPVQSALLYRIELGKILKGAPAATTMSVVVPLADGAPPSTDLSGEVLFLAGPLSPAQLAVWKLRDSGDVYQLLGGRFGAVEISGRTARLEAIRTYVSAADSTDVANYRLKWAERNARNPDAFLQTAAVLELERQTDKIRSLETLSHVVRSNASTLNARLLALQVIADSGTPQGVDTLRRAAENGRLPDMIRTRAAHELGDVAAGREILEKWAAGHDQLLVSAAAQALTSAH